MASLFRDGQKPPQAVLGIILGFMHRVASPTYVGIISLEIGWSLARTQEMLDHLEEQGQVRPLTIDEKKEMKFPSVGNIYVLTDGPKLSKARF